MEQARKQNLPLPDKIKNAPILLPGLQFYYQAFLDLSTCRPLGMPEGPIPWSAINIYAERQDLTDDDYERFFTLLRAMDAAYLDYRDKKRVTKENKEKQEQSDGSVL